MGQHLPEGARTAADCRTRGCARDGHNDGWPRHGVGEAREHLPLDMARSTEPQVTQGDRAADELDTRGQLRTALVSVFAAGALVLLKLGTGLVTGSLGLVSAGVESSGDVVAAVLTLFAIRLGGRPADANHPYGHRRAENLAALGEAAILAGGGLVVVVAAIGRLTGGGEPFEPHWYVFVVIAVALTVDVSRVLVSVRGAEHYKSAALRSNAFHFAGDMAGSLAVLAGLVAVSAGFQQGDALAALLVAAIIFAAAARLIVENARVLMDTTPAEAHARAHAAISDLGDDIDLRRLRVRESGGHYFADAIVAVPPGQAAIEGQGIADHIEAAVRRALPDIDVVVHLEPRREGLALRDVALAAALAQPLVRDVHDISIYKHGKRESVSLHLKLDPDVPLADGHEVAERVEAVLRAQPASMTCTRTSSRWSGHSWPATRSASPTRARGNASRGWSSTAPASRRASCDCYTPTTDWSCSCPSLPGLTRRCPMPTSSQADSKTTSARRSRT